MTVASEPAASDVDRVTEGTECRLVERLALGRMDMDCRRNVLKPRAHLERQREASGKLGDAGAHALDAECQMSVASGDDADEARVASEGQRSAVGLQRENRRRNSVPCR